MRKNREKINERNRDYYNKFTEKRKAVCHNTRTKRAKAKGHHTGEEIIEIYKKQKGKCAYCKIEVKKKYHVEHKTPLCRGGTNWARNLQITCQPCNQRKSYKTHKEFLKTTYYKTLTHKKGN